MIFLVDMGKMNQVLDLAHHMGMSIYWSEDIDCFKVNVYFQKYGFVTGISIPIEAIEDIECNEFWVSKIKEANDLLEAYKEKMREKKRVANFTQTLTEKGVEQNDN